VGKVTAGAAKASGLTEGTPVVIGGGDGPCATAGAGVVRLGEAYIYVGSSTWMGLASDRPLIDPKMRTATFGHFKKNLYMPAGTMQAGGGSFKWFKDVLGDLESKAAERAGVDAYDLLSLKAEQAPVGSEGLLFLPYLMGERSPLWDPNARGCFLGFSMLHGKRHLVRAVLEGVAFNMRQILEAFAELGVTSEAVRMIGGGAKSRLWRSIFADVLERPIQRLNFIEEATSVGAAVAGGVGVGLIPSLEEAGRFVRVVEETRPDPTHFETYRRQYAIFKESYPNLREIFARLAGT
jgi:xylulokinase